MQPQTQTLPLSGLEFEMPSSNLGDACQVNPTDTYGNSSSSSQTIETHYDEHDSSGDVSNHLLCYSRRDDANR